MNLKAAVKNIRCIANRSQSDRSSLERVSEQARKVRAALQRELWLPLGLRSLVAEEIAAILRGADRAQGSFRPIAAPVESIAFAVYAYEELAGESEVIATALAMDLELREQACLRKLSSLDEGDSFGISDLFEAAV